MVFHAVLQHTLRPQDDGRPGIRCCVYKRHRQNSNDCLSRTFADIKELLRLLFHCATFATSVCGSVPRTRDVWDRVRFTKLNSRGLEGACFDGQCALAGRPPHVVFLQQNISRITERTRAGFHQSQWDQPLPNAKYLVQATCLGSDTTDSAGSFFSRGLP